MTDKEKAKELASLLVGEDQNPQPLIDILLDMAKWKETQVKESVKTQHVDKTCKENGNSLTQEPISNDLEQAIDTYLKSYWGGEKEKQDWPFLKKIAIYFANWRKQQDKKWLANNHKQIFNNGYEEGFEAGRDDMEEQMMAKAVNGFVIEDIEEGNGDFLLSADYLSKDMGLKDRQKVKVIVIKEG